MNQGGAIEQPPAREIHVYENGKDAGESREHIVSGTGSRKTQF